LDPIRVTKARVAEGLGVRHEMAVRIRVIMVKGGRVRVATGLVVVGPAGLRFSFFPFRIPNPPSMLASYPDGCLAAALSANGAMLGCISSNGMLKVYSMPGAKQIFSTQVPFAIDGIARPLNLNIIAPIGTASAFSEPVGDFRATHLAALAGLDNPARILFSHDGHYVIAGLNGRDAPVVGADLSTLHKISVPGELALHLRSDPAFISDSEFAFHDPAKPESSAILSFPEGKTLQQLPAFTRVTAST